MKSLTQDESKKTRFILMLLLVSIGLGGSIWLLFFDKDEPLLSKTQNSTLQRTADARSEVEQNTSLSSSNSAAQQRLKNETVKARMNEQRLAIIANNRAANNDQSDGQTVLITRGASNNSQTRSLQSKGAFTTSPGKQSSTANINSNLVSREPASRRQAELDRSQRMKIQLDRRYSIPTYLNKAKSPQQARSILGSHLNRIGDQKLISLAQELKTPNSLIQHLKAAIEFRDESGATENTADTVNARLFEERQRLINKVANAYLNEFQN